MRFKQKGIGAAPIEVGSDFTYKNELFMVGHRASNQPEAIHGITAEARRGFISGHMIPLDYVTTHPYVLITAFAGNTLGSERKYLKWFNPIEQALGCLTLGDYRRRVALVKHWDAYSDFAIVIIPTGVHISYYFGPVAPQQYPSFSYDVQPSPDEVRIQKFVKTFNPSEVARKSLYEILAGGATQLFIKNVSKAYIYPTTEPILCPETKTPRRIKYAEKKDGVDWIEGHDRPSHLKDPLYDMGIMNLHGQLLKWGILDQNEHDVISNTFPYLQGDS